MKTILALLTLLSTVFATPIVVEDFASTNNKFAASIYKEIAQQKQDNFLVSPLSAQLILALSQEGAKGDTAFEMQSALKLPTCKELISYTIRELLSNLQKDHDYVLHTINKIYIKENCSLKEDFQSVARDVYQSPIESIDFGLKQTAANTINQWVEEETDNKITNLIDPEILSNQTRMVLLNVLRFKGNWSTPFQALATVKQDFTTFGNTVKVDTMHVYDEYFSFYEKPHLNASFLELPIEGGNASMTVVRPDTSEGLAILEEHINEVLETPLKKNRDIFNVALPKFKMESRIDLKEVLQRLGVKKAFQDGAADFSGIAGDKGELFIDDVIQKTFLGVSEDGIEAAAATFVVKIVNRNGESAREFVVDRPFLFFVKVEGLVVFIGRVVVPYF